MRFAGGGRAACLLIAERRDRVPITAMETLSLRAPTRVQLTRGFDDDAFERRKSGEERLKRLVFSIFSLNRVSRFEIRVEEKCLMVETLFLIFLKIFT